MIINKRIFQLLLAGFLLLTISCGTKKALEQEPDKKDFIISSDLKIKISDSLFFKGKNSLRKNVYGQWELVSSGNPMDLGNSIGDLSSHLVKKQEAVFFD
jgi:hypothetical protein